VRWGLGSVLPDQSIASTLLGPVQALIGLTQYGFKALCIVFQMGEADGKGHHEWTLGAVDGQPLDFGA